MFKAKVIEADKYYDFKHKILIYSLVASIPISVIGNFYNLSYQVIAIGLSLYVLVFVIMFNYNKKAKKLYGKRELEIDPNQILIKDNIGGAKRKISISDAEQIAVNANYGIIQDDLGSYKQELKGKFTKHYLEIVINGKTERFDFMIDSYYMAKQFRKIVDEWISNKLPITIE